MYHAANAADSALHYLLHYKGRLQVGCFVGKAEMMTLKSPWTLQEKEVPCPSVL